MMNSKTVLTCLAVGGLLLSASFSQAMAKKVAPEAAPAAVSEPNPAANPTLASIMNMGAKMYYLGRRAGLDGWIAIKDGHMQFVYAPPGSTEVLIGGLFGKDGESITSAQLMNLTQNNKEVADLMSNMAKEQADIVKAGAAQPATPEAQGATSKGLPTTPLSPGEKLIQDLSGAAGVDIGVKTAPKLYMVMDPNCPHCQATWRVLRDSVFKNSVQVRMIPIGTGGSESERAAAQLLHASDPLNVWDKYVNGDKTQLSGAPETALLAAVQANHLLIDSWSIHATPYLVYRGKDGKVRVVQGEPERMAAVLIDLVP